MKLLDVNVLVYAFRKDLPDHEAYLKWVNNLVNGDEAFGVFDLVLSGFLRVVTNPKVFNAPSKVSEAIRFTEQIRGRSQCIQVSPGSRHWAIFTELCLKAGAKGNLVPDAYFAALAIESGSEWITTDRGFSRFTGLRWRHPFEED